MLIAKASYCRACAWLCWCGWLVIKALAGIVGGLAGYWLNGWHRSKRSWSGQMTYGTATFSSGPVITPMHIHEATTQTPEGWFCECGRHYHRYQFPIAGKTDKRCFCGKEGTVSEWPSK